MAYTDVVEGDTIKRTWDASPETGYVQVQVLCAYCKCSERNGAIAHSRSCGRPAPAVRPAAAPVPLTFAAAQRDPNVSKEHADFLFEQEGRIKGGGWALNRDVD